MKELLLLTGGILIAAGILTQDKKEPTLEPDNAGITPNEQNDPEPTVDDDSGQSGGLDPV